MLRRYLGKYLSKVRELTMGWPRERAFKAERMADSKAPRHKRPSVFEEQQAGKCGWSTVKENAK